MDVVNPFLLPLGGVVFDGNHEEGSRTAGFSSISSFFSTFDTFTGDGGRSIFLTGGGVGVSLSADDRSSIKD